MEEDDKTVINPELGLTIQIKGTEFGSDYPSRSELIGSDRMDIGYVTRVQPSDANGFAVCKRARSKRLKSGSGAGIRCFGVVRGNSGICGKGDEAVVSNGEVGESGGDPVYAGGNEGDLGGSGYVDGEMVEIEVKEEPMVEAAAVARNNGTRRFTRSIIKSKDNKLESEFPGGSQDAVSLEVEVLESEESNARMMGTSKKTEIKGRPKTVKELFGTGLLEGYPVFYNGGKRRFPLRGSIKDSGILCFCSSCKGVRVVRPCQFEIHACKSYRRASQYICLDNGKSLLDVVKECQKSSVKTLEETIHKFVGPMPVTESVICMNCQGPFLAPALEVEPVCDSCMIIGNSDFDAEYAKSSSTCQQPVLKSALANHSKSSSDLRANVRYSLQGSMRSVNKRKILKKFSNTSVSKPLGSAHISMKSKSSSKSKITKRYQKLHRMVFEDGGLPDGTEVAYYYNGKKLRDGYKMGWGIMCRCCRTLVSPSRFEAHAGRASRRNPYMYIYTSNGVSLHEFAVSMLKGHKLSADGGKLVLCDGCSRAFHEGSELPMLFSLVIFDFKILVNKLIEHNNLSTINYKKQSIDVYEVEGWFGVLKSLFQ